MKNLFNLKIKTKLALLPVVLAMLMVVVYFVSYLFITNLEKMAKQSSLANSIVDELFVSAQNRERFLFNKDLSAYSLIDKSFEEVSTKSLELSHLIEEKALQKDAVSSEKSAKKIKKKFKKYKKSVEASILSEQEMQDILDNIIMNNETLAQSLDTQTLERAQSGASIKKIKKSIVSASAVNNLKSMFLSLRILISDKKNYIDEKKRKRILFEIEEIKNYLLFLKKKVEKK
ncbi:hypothetical protein JHD50_09605 [Sulfurimonas sp. MAG313]|nr:hypothetical protein [Sulfurimonas sp. MAG313]MDF1881553.1 hypothetical protein [Sulfurimonas sp. MAG313]